MEATTSAQETGTKTITSVVIEDLFGLFAYNIRIPEATVPGKPSLLILYGDNGTGKTTLLQLVYHLLAKEDNRGHRSFLARTPFRRLTVTLSDHTSVTARRSGDALIGGFELEIRRGEVSIARADALVDKDLAVRAEKLMTHDQRRHWATFMDRLAEIEVSMFFLADDRKVQEAEDQDIVRFVDMDKEDWLASKRTVYQLRSGLANARPELERAIDELETWIRDEALRATNVGEENTNTIYAGIVRRIARTKKPGRPKSRGPDTVQLLHDLEDRSRPFSTLGFVSTLRLGEIASTLSAASKPTRRILDDAIGPYVDGLRARLDALESVQTLVSLLLERLNTFYANKLVTYNLGRGLRISTLGGSALSPSQLSSGERQLLLLFARVLMARRNVSIFLIDEPELSLNVKWQRRLINTLLDFVRGTSVQFILATHSVELLATHRAFVHRLVGHGSD